MTVKIIFLFMHRLISTVVYTKDIMFYVVPGVVNTESNVKLDLRNRINRDLVPAAVIVNVVSNRAPTLNIAIDLISRKLFAFHINLRSSQRTQQVEQPIRAWTIYIR